jgi:hypothetical protein
MKTETPSTPPLQKLMLPNLDAFSWWSSPTRRLD